MLGDALFPKVLTLQPALASAVTGYILGCMDNSMTLELLASDTKLSNTIDEVIGREDAAGIAAVQHLPMEFAAAANADKLDGVKTGRWEHRLRRCRHQ